MKVEFEMKVFYYLMIIMFFLLLDLGCESCFVVRVSSCLMLFLLVRVT